MNTMKNLKEYYEQLKEVNEKRAEENLRLLELFNSDREGTTTLIYATTYPEIQFTYDGYLEWLASDGASLLKLLPKEETNE